MNMLFLFAAALWIAIIAVLFSAGLRQSEDAMCASGSTYCNPGARHARL
jgi:hypothetical protein